MFLGLLVGVGIGFVTSGAATRTAPRRQSSPVAPESDETANVAGVEAGDDAVPVTAPVVFATVGRTAWFPAEATLKMNRIVAVPPDGPVPGLIVKYPLCAGMWLDNEVVLCDAILDRPEGIAPGHIRWTLSIANLSARAKPICLRPEIFRGEIRDANLLWRVDDAFEVIVPRGEFRLSGEAPISESEDLATLRFWGRTWMERER